VPYPAGGIVDIVARTSLALMTSDYEKLTEVMKASGLGPERGEPGLATSSLRGA
jgi:tripartite-type tricarboxylate transporter receptor subunit TctC